MTVAEADEVIVEAEDVGAVDADVGGYDIEEVAVVEEAACGVFPENSVSV